MSTGAWIFTGLICAAVIAPASVYAASMTRVALAGLHGTNAADVTAQHQLLTTPISSSRVVRITGGSLTPVCNTIYTPPAHKAIVVTSVTYTFGSGTAGQEQYGGLGPGNCSKIWDQIDTVQAFDTIQHTFPSGLPMPSIGLTNNSTHLINVFILGYLIDATALPPAGMTHVSNNVKGLAPGR
jgi:hypothetical protein